MKDIFKKLIFVSFLCFIIAGLPVLAQTSEDTPVTPGKVRRSSAVPGPTITSAGMSDNQTATPEEIGKEAVSKQITDAAVKEGTQKIEDITSLQAKLFFTTAPLLCMKSFAKKVILRIFSSSPEKNLFMSAAAIRCAGL